MRNFFTRKGGSEQNSSGDTETKCYLLPINVNEVYFLMNFTWCRIFMEEQSLPWLLRFLWSNNDFVLWRSCRLWMKYSFIGEKRSNRILGIFPFTVKQKCFLFSIQKLRLAYFTTFFNWLNTAMFVLCPMTKGNISPVNQSCFSGQINGRAHAKDIQFQAKLIRICPKQKLS